MGVHDGPEYAKRVREVKVRMGDDEAVNISKVDPKKNHPIPPYFNLGRLGKLNHGIEGFDTCSALSQMSGNAGKFFWFLVKNRDWETNLVKLDKMYSQTKTEKDRIKRNYPELKGLHLIIRAAPRVYLINPKAVLPTHAYFERTWDYWCESCKKNGVLPEPLVIKPQSSRLAGFSHKI